MLQKWFNPLSRALNSGEYSFANGRQIAGQTLWYRERQSKTKNFPSAVLFIASSRPAFCGYSAPSQRRYDAEARMPSDGSVAGGSRGSPKSPGMWHRTPWGCVRVGSCPPSHNPSPGVITWLVTWGQHRWTFIQPHLMAGYSRTSLVDLVGEAADVKELETERLFFFF